MSIKDEINKSFKVGNLITNNYADKAEINVKEFYELDKLNRGRTLQLAGMTDIELAKINGDLGTKDLKLKEIEEKLEELEATGGSSEGREEGRRGGGSNRVSKEKFVFREGCTVVGTRKKNCGRAQAQIVTPLVFLDDPATEKKMGEITVD